MNLIKAALVGAIGSLVMFLIVEPMINMGLAPFNQSPSTAFLTLIGLNFGPLPLAVHFGYGMFWSVVFYFLFRERMNIAKGELFAIGLWLIMMVIYSPMIGWGLFGFGDAGNLPANDPLYLKPGPQFMIATFALHMVYGFIIGWLNPYWILRRQVG